MGTASLPFDPNDLDRRFSQTGWAAEVRDVDGAYLYCSTCTDNLGDERLKPIRLVGVAGPPGTWTGECEICGGALGKEILLVLASWPTLCKVIRYEAWMFSETAKKLASGSFSDQVAANTTIEAFAIHTRQLLDFLFAERQEKWNNRKTDLIAEWFLEDPSAWDAAPSQLLAETRERVGKFVAHMTRTRAGIETKEKTWDFVPIRAEVVGHLAAFANCASVNRLDGKTKAQLLSLSD